ncbi:LCP family glycopolymer transferase [Nocardia sp. R6R-6]|uniref:LCP family glycopolymer transferase n=1 Tax=Nocardia sp. R6R-6 TaxID=3459303 RepID=UPI00403DE5F8
MMHDSTEPLAIVASARTGRGRGRHAKSERPTRVDGSAPAGRRSRKGRAGERSLADLTTDRYEPVRPRRVDHKRRAPSGKVVRGLRIAARVLAAATALAVVSGTGFAYYTEHSIDSGFTRSRAISAEDAAALDGDLNILLIGLDTRKDQNGNDLSQNILDQLHAGDSDNGGYNANSLILMHIPKDLTKITAFSIPRDDYVAVTGIPGYDHAKIKEAYGLKKAAVEQKLMNQGVKDKLELERQGREAGRESIVQTVKQLTGVPINRFAEVSLVGFYDIATILGGVDVCLNHAVHDAYYSGAVFPAGPQHLDAANALAFVRQRHGLDNGDLDRTHRQQAFLTSVATQLKSSGTLTDGKLPQLINAAQNDIVLSQGWNLLDFAQTLGKAGSVPIEFQTLPVKAYDTVDGQDVNVIDPALIKKTVRTAFGVQTTPPARSVTTPASIVDVVNAGSHTGMAAKVSAALAAKGYGKGAIGNAAAFTDGSSSVVYYNTGSGSADAIQVADLLGGLPTAAALTVEAGHVKVVVGDDFTLPDDSTDPSTSDAPPTGTTTSPSPATLTAGIPDSGKPVTTTIGSTIPCVN